MKFTKTVITCDRCGHEIQGKPHKLQKEDDERNLFNYDLCDKCQKELLDWYYRKPFGEVEA